MAPLTKTNEFKKIPPPIAPKTNQTYLMYNNIKNELQSKTSIQNVGYRDQPQVKKTMNDDEVLEKLKKITKQDDPSKTYDIKERLGAGYAYKI